MVKTPDTLVGQTVECAGLTGWVEQVATATQVNVAQRRLSEFLREDELGVGSEDDGRAAAPANDGFGLAAIERGSFRWSDDSPVVLSGVNFRVAHGKLGAVIGSVGSGKSSLLAGLMGELRKLSGRIELRGRIAFCSQQPWLISGTLRENVLFGLPFEEEKFWGAIEACGLLQDLEQLPAGEETGIGEKGINISGVTRIYHGICPPAPRFAHAASKLTEISLCCWLPHTK